MATEILSPLGPLLGPNFITITQNDKTGGHFRSSEVYPDANNPLLRSNGMPMHFYFVPQRVLLAKKQTAPADFDFAMTVVKGLLTSESTLGITDDVTAGGVVEVGGGFCTFSATFAVLESVVRGAVQQTRPQQGLSPNEPTPELGIVTIVENNVTIEVPELSHITAGKMTPFISAQGAGKGSLEATGIGAFLVTLNLIAAGALAGSLKAGKSPLHRALQSQTAVLSRRVPGRGESRRRLGLRSDLRRTFRRRFPRNRRDLPRGRLSINGEEWRHYDTNYQEQCRDRRCNQEDDRHASGRNAQDRARPGQARFQPDSRHARQHKPRLLQQRFRRRVRFDEGKLPKARGSPLARPLIWTDPSRCTTPRAATSTIWNRRSARTSTSISRLSTSATPSRSCRSPPPIT
jgi:hypothetical protein